MIAVYICVSTDNQNLDRLARKIAGIKDDFEVTSVCQMCEKKLSASIEANFLKIDNSRYGKADG